MGNHVFCEPSTGQKQLRPRAGVESLIKVNVVRFQLHPQLWLWTTAGNKDLHKLKLGSFVDSPVDSQKAELKGEEHLVYA